MNPRKRSEVTALLPEILRLNNNNICKMFCELSMFNIYHSNVPFPHFMKVKEIINAVMWFLNNQEYESPTSNYIKWLFNNTSDIEEYESIRKQFYECSSRII